MYNLIKSKLQSKKGLISIQVIIITAIIGIVAVIFVSASMGGFQNGFLGGMNMLKR